MTKRSERVGFIGLGVMGSAMARRLLTKGFNLTIYDIDKAKSGPLASHINCINAETPAEVMRLLSRLIILLASYFFRAKFFRPRTELPVSN